MSRTRTESASSSDLRVGPRHPRLHHAGHRASADRVGRMAAMMDLDSLAIMLTAPPAALPDPVSPEDWWGDLRAGPATAMCGEDAPPRKNGPRAAEPVVQARVAWWLLQRTSLSGRLLG